MTIRNMISEDYDQVYALWLSCRGMGLNNIDDSKAGIETFLRRNPETCFVASEKEQLIGVILTGHDGRRGYIYHMAVSPEHRHMGVGRQLVAASLDSLKKQGIIKACLVAYDRNQDGNAFWESMGFAKRTDLVYRDLALAEMIRIDT